MHIYQILAQIDTSTLPHPQANNNAITSALDIVFAITGSISVLMVVIGGLRYILARGDPKSMAQARSTILYAIIGLLLTVSAFSIVTFVIKGTTS